MTSLADSHPKFAAEWDYDKNDPLTPHKVSSGSAKKVWWKCSKGHSWAAVVQSRTRPGSGKCPVCINRLIVIGVNDLQTTNPEIASQWSTRNTSSPQEIGGGSKLKRWWICQKGHEWEAPVADRQRFGCPYCAGNHVLPGFNDLTTTDPTLSLQISPDSLVTATQVTRFSGRKVRWVCGNGHEWLSTVANRSNGSGCPQCVTPHTSRTESKLFNAFNEKTTTVQTYRAGSWDNGRGMYVDLYLPEYTAVVEYDGIRWHTSEVNKERDTRKTKALLDANYRVVRIRENTLPLLDMEDSNLIQFNHTWTRQEDFHDVVERTLTLLAV